MELPLLVKVVPCLLACFSTAHKTALIKCTTGQCCNHYGMIVLSIVPGTSSATTNRYESRQKGTRGTKIQVIVSTIFVRKRVQELRVMTRLPPLGAARAHRREPNPHQISGAGGWEKQITFRQTGNRSEVASNCMNLNLSGSSRNIEKSNVTKAGFKKPQHFAR